MKHMIFLVVIIMTLFLTQCKNDDEVSPDGDVYQSEVILENSLPVLGGFTDSVGNLVSFNLPLVLDGNIELSAKVNRYEGFKRIQRLYDFRNKNFFYGSWSYDTFSNRYGAIPLNAIVDLTSLGNEKFAMSHIRDSELYIFTNGQIEYIEAVEGLLSVASNSKNELFAIRAPAFTRDGELATPPTIFMLDSFNHLFEYFRFSTAEYNYGGLYDSFPGDIRINLSFDKEDNLYICFGLDNIIYKLDKAKNLSVYRKDIFCPTSLTFSDSNIPFVFSGSKIEKSSDKVELKKPGEVLKLSFTGDKVIYEIDQFKHETGLSRVGDTGYFTNGGGHYNLNANHLGEVFLEDPINCEIILLNRL